MATDIYPRAATLRVARSTEHFYDYSVCVEGFVSLDDEDRGGVVIRLIGNDEGFMPYAVKTAEGVEMHIAGEGEARAAIANLLAVLSELQKHYPSPGNDPEAA